MAQISAQKLFDLLGDTEENYNNVALCVNGSKILFLQCVMFGDSVVMRTSMSDEPKWFGCMTHFVEISKNVLLFLKSVASRESQQILYFSVTAGNLRISNEKGNHLFTEIKRTEYSDTDENVLWSSVILLDDNSKDNLRKALLTTVGQQQQQIIPPSSEISLDDNEGDEMEEEGCTQEEMIDRLDCVEFSREYLLVNKRNNFRYSIPVVHEHGVSRSVFAISIETFVNVLTVFHSVSSIKVFFLHSGTVVFEAAKVILCVNPLWTKMQIKPPRKKTEKRRRLDDDEE